VTALRPWEISSAAADFEETMPDRCTIRRRSGVQDEWGGGAEDSVVATDVPVAVSPIDVVGFAGDQDVGERTADFTRYKLAFPRGTDIRGQDLVEFTTGPPTSIRISTVMRAETWDIIVTARGVAVL
jgi:hypothetical protein